MSKEDIGGKEAGVVKASEDHDDLDDFLDLIGDSSEPKQNNRLKALLNSSTYERDADTDGKEGKALAGGPVQYSLFGTGYVPTTKTVKTLPPGAYHTRFSQAVGIYLDRANVITDELIEFPDTQSEKIIAEINLFWTLKEKFSSMGFSHKRGILLWGPPGSGKSCTIALVMKKMVERNGLIIIADVPQFLSGALSSLRSIEPDRPVVVIWEDIDAVIRQHGESEVLAILDGESQVDNIMFIASTNYPENLDARITNRPSRFDRIEKISMPSPEARAIYLKAKAKTTISPDGVDLVAESEGFSIAHLRELVVAIWCLGSPTQEVLKRLHKMKVKPNSESANGPVGFGS